MSVWPLRRAPLVVWPGRQLHPAARLQKQKLRGRDSSGEKTVVSLVPTFAIVGQTWAAHLHCFGPSLLSRERNRLPFTWNRLDRLGIRRILRRLRLQRADELFERREHRRVLPCV